MKSLIFKIVIPLISLQSTVAQATATFVIELQVLFPCRDFWAKSTQIIEILDITVTYFCLVFIILLLSTVAQATFVVELQVLFP